MELLINQLIGTIILRINQLTTFNNMLFRCAVRTLGLGARPLLNPSTPTTAPRFLSAALYTGFQPTRLSSSSCDSSRPSTLTPPWQLEDLPPREKKAYQEYGNNYFDHLTDSKKTRALASQAARAQLAARLEEFNGPDWYSILKEIDRRFEAEVRNPTLADFERRGALLGPVVDWRKPPPEHRQLSRDRKEFKRSSVDLKRKFREKILEDIKSKA